jgi:hypothetical protein
MADASNMAGEEGGMFLFCGCLLRSRMKMRYAPA